MRRHVMIITISTEVAAFYRAVLEELFGAFIDVSVYSMEAGGLPDNSLEADLFFLGTTSSEDLNRVIKRLPPDAAYVLSDVTYARSALDELRKLPQGTKAMLVNLSATMAVESISQLHFLGIHHIEMAPVFPGSDVDETLTIAITPGEQRYVPPGIEQIIDIGHRLPSISAITEIALKLDMRYVLEQDHVRAYFSRLATTNYTIDALLSESTLRESQFDILMGILDMGIIGVNHLNRIYALNKMAERMSGLRRATALGNRIEDVLPEIPIMECRERMVELRSGRTDIDGKPLSFRVKPVIRRGVYLGAFVIFTQPKPVENRKSVHSAKGHSAKYTFADILGESKTMQKLRNYAKKMAKTEASILITGETGTGKELFAHSIHQASARSDAPFVAINCAAIPDNLLESELFGYEEGAFTGARKTGRMGLFEIAHGGTLFLDEIEGMSPNLQIKLLRVIQEREIMRVGGHDIIKVDVRVIAASNEKLYDLVRENVFRKDLYYRINTLSIDIPPLRERIEDIPVLIEDMRARFGLNFRLSPDVEQVFREYRWEGNVRELRNHIEFFGFLDKAVIDFEDLPLLMQKEMSDFWRGEKKNDLPKPCGEEEAQLFVLECMRDAMEEKRHIGRKQIADIAEEKKLFLTEQEIRTIMARCGEMGLVEIKRGRSGSTITQKGMEYLQNKAGFNG